MPGKPTGTITFLFTDVEGSTQLWERQQDAMRQALAQHDACLRAALEAHDGHIFKTIGDAFCTAFTRAADALQAAIAVQQRLREFGFWILDFGTEESPADNPKSRIQNPKSRVRIALHTGVAEEREGDYFGPTVNRVARLLAVGHGGQVLLSQTTRDLVQNELPPDVALRDLGTHRLRHLLQPEHIYQLLHPDLPADFRPLRSISNLSHNLPQQVTRFVGREREMAEIQRLLATTHLLTLTGTGGAGKTRLALQVADELISEYEDGIWLVELAPLADPALVLPTVAAALAVREEPEGPLQPRRPLTQTLVEALQPRHLLLILDNCEHVLTACAHLVHALVRACPHLRILATSRQRLNIQGEQTFHVPSLSTPDPRELSVAPGDSDLVAAITRFEAVQLFLDRAALIQSTFSLTPQNAPAVAEVCHQLGGIPLAIELAVARLKVLSVEQLAPRLNDMFRLLKGGSAAALKRQQTLRALIDWSYDLLSEEERTLLRRLSVFVGGFTLEAAENVTGGEVEGGGAGNSIEPTAVLDLLGQLVDQSLVWVDEEGQRYQLLETIRQYGSEKLWEAGEGMVARLRFRGWALTRAERALRELPDVDQAGWLQELVVEYDNLRAALGPAARTHPRGQAGQEPRDLPLLPPRLSRWGQAIEQLVPTYRLLGRTEAARGLLDDFIALCQTEGNPQWLARAITLMGRFLKVSPGEAAERAGSLYERAIELCEAHGLDDWIVYPRSQLAYELASAGTDLQRAEEIARATLSSEHARQIDPPWWGEVDPTTAEQLCHTTLMLIALRRADWAAFNEAFQASLASGGPLAFPVQFMLASLEEIYHQQGADARFRELCHLLREGYASAGLETPFQQWYLEATAPRTFLGEPWLKEEFDGEEWHSSLQWQDVTGGSRADQTSRPGWIGLHPAENSDLWPGKNFSAPRLVAAVKGDFAVQTRLELGQPDRVFAGLLVWQSQRDFARLELRTIGGGRASVNMEASIDGEFRPVGRGQSDPQPGADAAGGWLRVERIGEELRGLCSADGEQWLACGTVRLPRRGPEQAGLAAIWQEPNAHAWFDTLLIWQGTGP